MHLGLGAPSSSCAASHCITLHGTTLAHCALQNVALHPTSRTWQTESQKGRAEEARLQRELSQLQAAMSANMERIRVETAEVGESVSICRCISIL